MKKVLVAGATGYLGKHLLAALKMQRYATIALARTLKKLPENAADTIGQAEVTQAETLNGICQNVDVVISCVGITRQKDGLTYMDVDYQANANLLKEAKRSGVKKFIYISLLNGPSLRKLKMVNAKERFVDELKTSGIGHTVIRPNGFFSDMKEELHMAQKEKIIHIPIWIKNLTLFFVRLFSSQKTYGPIEFFMTVMTRDMIAPTCGRPHLADFFKKNSSI